MANFEEVEKIKIPDEDIPGWIKSLHEGGFSSEEIDEVLGNLNLTYKKAKDPDVIERELLAIKDYYRNNYNKILTKKEIEYFREGLENEL